MGAVLLSGCEGTRNDIQDLLGEMDNEPRTLAFACDDDRDFRVRLSGDRQEARVDVGDKTYRLDEAGRDDGRRVYRDEDGDVRLTMDGDDAHLRLAGADDYRDCRRS
jgi:hypothetical protein